MSRNLKLPLLIALGAGFFFVVTYFLSAPAEPVEYQSAAKIDSVDTVPKKITPHQPVPSAVKAIYMTSWVAGTKDFREELVALVDSTEVNSIVIDIKDYTGKLSFEPENEELKSFGGYEKRIPDIREFLEYLHSKNIYVIGRLAVFQDPYLVKKWPEHAVKRATDGEVWKDRKGITWIDPGSKDAWDYIASIAEESYRIGFDEINFDYIRFPSDGDMTNIYYPWSQSLTKADVIRDFFSFMHSHFRSSTTPPDMKPVLSADLFGMTTTNKDDLNIGQILENAFPFLDYIGPMVYPSHYPTNFIGLANPAESPYEVIKYSMDKAVLRAKAASTTPLKLRPWIQDFDLGADYDAAKVRAQIQAVYDSGLTSWMIWAPSNRYTKDALLKE